MRQSHATQSHATQHHAYSPRQFAFAVVGQDALLAAVVAVALLALASGGGSPFLYALGAGAFAVLAWGFGTLNFPSHVEQTEDGITFRRYGRAHSFAWRDVRAVRVRRFLVRDRVFVRLEPSTALRGRYWLLDGLSGYSDLVRELERHANAK